MRLGIDLRPLSTDGGQRGIGEVIKHITQDLVAKVPESFGFVFLVSDRGNEIRPELLFNIPPNREWITVTDRALASANVDLMLCYGYLPRPPKSVPVVLVIHDLIIAKFWSHFADYTLETVLPPSMYMLVKPFLKLRLFKALLRHIYLAYVRSRISGVKRIIVVSKTTRDDLISILGIDPARIDVIYLGVTENFSPDSDPCDMEMLPTKPYLLFIGAPDPKRDLVGLISAFETVRESGHDIQMAFAGSHFKSFETVSDPRLKQALGLSPHKDDIIFLGFISDQLRSAIYSHALAMVYPSMYEGFGIPVLEGMIARCPVIYFNNSAMKEVNDGFGFPVDGTNDLFSKITEILTLSSEQMKSLLDAAQQHARKFTWDRTSDGYLSLLLQELENRSR